MTKRILFVLYLPPPVHGAAMVGQYINNSIIVNQEFKCRYINVGTSYTVDEIGNKGLIKFIRYFTILCKVLFQLITFRPHVFYFTPTAQGIGFYKDFLVALLPKLFRIKVVYHLHNKGVNTRQHRFFDNILYRFAFSNVDVIILSKHLYPDIQKYVSQDRVHYCANGIPDKVSKFKYKASHLDISIIEYNKNDLPKSNVNILFLSNLIISKGVYVLFEACKILKEKYIPFHCTFVGGEGDINLQQFTDISLQLGIENHITYAGMKFGNEKTVEFEKSSVFVHPSYNDCFPLVLLEAMQHSMPIVSTYEGAIPEIVEEGVNGFLVPPKDAYKLAEKLELLILNPGLRQQMGHASHAKYKNDFTLAIFEEKLKTILNLIIDENH